MDVLYKPILKLHKKLEKILEEDSATFEENQRIQSQFETKLEIPHFSMEGLPSDELDRVAWLFSQLVPFFEYGLLLSKHGEFTKAVAQFDRGVLVHSKKEILISIKTHQLPYLSFLKNKGSSDFLKKIFNSATDREDVFLMRLTPDFSLLIGTRIAPPWQNQHLENMQKLLSQAMSL